MKVFSLFDGISCGKVALERAGIEVDQYYASEIDEGAIAISKERHPDIVHLGSVTDWKNWDIDFSEIDLLIGGSPCTGFSIAAKVFYSRKIKVSCLKIFSMKMLIWIL